MLRLDSTLRKLEILLSGAVTTTQPAFMASWSDGGSSTYVGGATPGTTNGASAVTLVAAPASGIVRDIDYVSVNNLDSATATVTVRFNDNGTSYNIITVALAAGSHLNYTHAHGWEVLDSNGVLKTGVTGPQGATGAIGPMMLADYSEESYGEFLSLFPGAPFARTDVDVIFQGRMGIGGAPATNVLQTLIGDSAIDSNRTANVNLFTYSSTSAALTSSLAGVRYRGNAASPSAVLSGDKMFGFVAGGATSSSTTSNSAAIDFYAAENYSSTTAGSYISFLTTVVGTVGRRECFRIDDAGNALMKNGGSLGYGPGTGSTVTQSTSKATGVTLNFPSGQITTASDALLPATTVSFTLTNSKIAADDLIAVARKSGGTAGAYQVWMDSVAAGSCVINIRNLGAVSLSEALVLQFDVLRGATT